MSRRRVIVGGTVVLVLGALVAGFLAWFGAPFPTRDVALPPDDATPEEVVAVYLDALDAHDCDTANALWAQPDGARAWCPALKGIEDVDIDAAESERQGKRTRMHVFVEWDLTWRPFASVSGDAEDFWGFYLARESDADPWRIVDQGVT